MSGWIEAHRLLWEEFRAPWATALAVGVALPIAGTWLAVRRASASALALPQAAYAAMAAATWWWAAKRAAGGDAGD
ncbi:MAG TPA: hypothetical protein VEI02_01070, partial [Planctomycetota bacterium]|nr:hypothetical protein [Planctomycetota bacterium]